MRVSRPRRREAASALLGSAVRDAVGELPMVRRRRFLALVVGLERRRRGHGYAGYRGLQLRAEVALEVALHPVFRAS